MRKLVSAFVVLAACAVGHAHFIWAQFETDRAVSFYLGEQAGEDLLPTMARLQPKLNFLSPKLTVASNDGTRASFALGLSSPVTLTKMEYGVVDRGQGVYKLTYFSKAVSRPSEAQNLVGKGFELTASLSGNQWVIAAWLDGKPFAEGVEVFLANGEKLSVQGGVIATPVVSGALLQLRASRSTKIKGSFEGKDYSSGREWTTLSVPATTFFSEGSDVFAYRMLQRAAESRETLALTTPLQMTFTAKGGDDTLNGRVSVKPGECTVTFVVPESSYTKHVRSQVQSLFLHRMGRPFEQGDGKYVITTGETNASGTRLFIADSLNSKYRVKDGRITEVIRDMNGETLTLEITKFQETRPGRYLSKEFTSRSVKAGSLRSDLKYLDEFQILGSDWLPKRRLITGTSEGKPLRMEVVFEKAVTPSPGT